MSSRPPSPLAPSGYHQRSGQLPPARPPWWMGAAVWASIPLLAIVLTATLRGPVDAAIPAAGTVEGARAQVLSSPRAALVAEVAVREGDAVARGQLLLRLTTLPPGPVAPVEIRAPQAGRIVALRPLAAGERVDAGAPLARLIPEGDALVVRLDVPEGAARRAAVGQRVRFRAADAPAFDPMLRGRVAAVTAGTAWAAPGRTGVEVEPDPSASPLPAGTPVAAEIVTGTRTLWDLLFK